MRLQGWKFTIQDLTPCFTSFCSTTEEVHPTQIYETILMGFVFIYLRTIRKKDAPAGWLFSIFLILAGLERFLIEFIRSTTPSPIAYLSVAQVMAIGVVVVGVVKLVRIQAVKGSAEKEWKKR